MRHDKKNCDNADNGRIYNCPPLNSDLKKSYLLEKENYVILGKLLAFYLLEISDNSDLSNSLEYYNWKGNGAYAKLNKILKELVSQEEEIFLAVKRKNFQGKLVEENLYENFNYCKNRIVFTKSKSNKFKSFFNHLRNSFAHGLYGLYEYEGNRYFWFEDKSGPRVTMRGILNEELILKIPAIIQNGPTNL